MKIGSPAYRKTAALMDRLIARFGLSDGPSDPSVWDLALVLRRAEKTLHRWDELECGNSNSFGAWAIERDEVGRPEMVHHNYMTTPVQTSRTRIADREAGAIRRVKKALEPFKGLYAYHQGDPRGCALWIVNEEPRIETTYTNGVACCD